MTAMLGWFSLDDDAPDGEADRILARLAKGLADAGLRLAGAVQRNTDLGADCACDMDVLVIGEEDAPIRISQSLAADRPAAGWIPAPWKWRRRVSRHGWRVPNC